MRGWRGGPSDETSEQSSNDRTGQAPGRSPGDQGGVRAAGRAIDLRLLWRVWGYVRPYRASLLVSLILLPVIAAFEIAQPYFLRRAIDDHIAPGRLHGLDRLGLLYLGAMLGQYVASFAQGYLVQIAGQRSMDDLRRAAHRHVLELRAGFFDRTPVGQLMTRLTSDIESLGEMFASGIISLVGDVIRLAMIVVVMFKVDAKLALFSMIAVPSLAVLAALFRRWMRDAFRQIRVKLAHLNSFLQEHLSGVKVVQAFAREERVAQEFDVVNRDYRRANARAIAADAALYSVVEAVASIAVAGLLWHGGARLVSATLTFGVLVQFTEYLGKFFAPLRDLSAKYTVMQQAVAAAERVFALLDNRDLDAPSINPGVPKTPALPGMAPGVAPAPAVAFEQVSFGYRPDQPVLREVSFSIAEGETVAIVGATGAGKSSLIKLLARLYEPQAGNISVAGRDIRAWDRKALRRHIVAVSQDVFLFSGSVAQNVALGDPTVGEERIAAALRAVGADVRLARRSGGIHATVTERGSNFSAGERQLLAFARALCRDPRLLVLDEATSSVDPEIERLIERGIAELMRGRTSIVIAHRLSTIRRADRILVLDHGRLVEEGQHEQLLAGGGIYARLYALQASPELPVRTSAPAGRSR